MPINTSKVFVGTPDQLTTGAVLHAPLGTQLPDLDDITPSGVTIDEAFKDGGYVSSDGVTITPDYSTTDINDWSGATVRRILESFTGEVSYAFIQTDETSMAMTFGESNVESSPADATHGNRMKIGIGAELPPAESVIFKMKDGAARILILLPNSQVTSMEEIAFSATDAVTWSITRSCYPDENGKSIYILTDDGQVASA